MEGEGGYSTSSTGAQYKIVEFGNGFFSYFFRQNKIYYKTKDIHNVSHVQPLA